MGQGGSEPIPLRPLARLESRAGFFMLAPIAIGFPSEGVSLFVGCADVEASCRLQDLQRQLLAALRLSQLAKLLGLRVDGVHELSLRFDQESVPPMGCFPIGVDEGWRGGAARPERVAVQNSRHVWGVPGEGRGSYLAVSAGGIRHALKMRTKARLSTSVLSSGRDSVTQLP
jgi:hypothetical protein